MGEWEEVVEHKELGCLTLAMEGSAIHTMVIQEPHFLSSLEEAIHLLLSSQQVLEVWVEVQRAWILILMSELVVEIWLVVNLAGLQASVPMVGFQINKLRCKIRPLRERSPPVWRILQKEQKRK